MCMCLLYLFLSLFFFFLFFFHFIDYLCVKQWLTEQLWWTELDFWPVLQVNTLHLFFFRWLAAQWINKQASGYCLPSLLASRAEICSSVHSRHNGDARILPVSAEGAWSYSGQSFGRAVILSRGRATVLCDRMQACDRESGLYYVGLICLICYVWSLPMYDIAVCQHISSPISYRQLQLL